MEKRAVERYMPLADKAIGEIFKKSENGGIKIDKTYRSKLSAFGATVIMSGLLPAIAYYNKNEKKIIDLLQNMYKQDNAQDNNCSLYNLIMKETDINKLDEIKELIINYSISLKLVMNLYI